MKRKSKASVDEVKKIFRRTMFKEKDLCGIKPGDIFKNRGKYYLNIRPECDTIEDRDQFEDEIYVIEGNKLSSGQVAKIKKDQHSKSGFIEKISEAFVFLFVPGLILPGQHARTALSFPKRQNKVRCGSFLFSVITSSRSTPSRFKPSGSFAPAIDAIVGYRSKAYTGGEIRIPPTIWKGRALVGSGDGWVYAFEVTTGRLLWRFRAAPAERKIPVYGKLLSTWPAASGVLVEDGTAYVAAGLVNYDGTYVYALDPATGNVRWCNDTSGHLDPEANTGVSVQGHLLLYEDKLYLAGGSAVSPAVYDILDGKCLNDPAPLANCESTSPRGWELSLIGNRVIACGRPFYSRPDIPVYDHTVTKKLLHASTVQRDIVWIDNSKLLCYKPLERDALSRCVTDEKIPRHITQAWGQFKVSEKPLWQHDCPDSIAVAITKNAVVFADASQVAALELRSGKQLWNHTLPSAPVPWGMAVDGTGRVFLTLVDGQVLCIGRRLERVVKHRSVQTGHHDPRPDVPGSVESISL